MGRHWPAMAIMRQSRIECETLPGRKYTPSAQLHNWHAEIAGFPGATQKSLDHGRPFKITWSGGPPVEIRNERSWASRAPRYRMLKKRRSLLLPAVPRTARKHSRKMEHKIDYQDPLDRISAPCDLEQAEHRSVSPEFCLHAT